MVKRTLLDAQHLARSRGGKCLSERYIRSHAKLLWECAEGHQWSTTFNEVLQGCWCPQCRAGISERICRWYFETIFGRPFPSAKPAWLVSPKGYRMQLDGYCEELALAFEYQGMQHYHQVATMRPLFYQQECDELKRSQCQAHGIRLIEVPYTVSYEEMQGFVEAACVRQGVALPPDVPRIDYKTFAVYRHDRLTPLQEIARRRGGECLSPRFITTKTRLRWRCAVGHEWLAPPQAITSGQWCLICAGKQRLTIEEMQAIARSRYGECLSAEYVNAHVKLRWRCLFGHEWEAKPFKIKFGRWCRQCAFVRNGFRRRQQHLAKLAALRQAALHPNVPIAPAES